MHVKINVSVFSTNSPIVETKIGLEAALKGLQLISSNNCFEGLYHLFVQNNNIYLHPLSIPLLYMEIDCSS